MVFQIGGAVVLLLFYSIYLGKMLLQRQKGIRTDQMAKGNKQGKMFRTELMLKIAAYLVVFVECISIIKNTNALPVLFRWIGLAAAFLGVLFFAVSVHTMRDSWRAGIPENEHTEFVTNGIYRWSRNPAFLGFDLTYTGLLLMFGNPVLTVCTCFSVMMMHLQILQEEIYLENTFGREYNVYKKQVGRYFGRR